MINAGEIRHALAAVSHEMNGQYTDWQRLDEQEHLRIAEHALEQGDLAGATASMLFALEQHERSRLAAADEPTVAADSLRRSFDARRAR